MRCRRHNVREHRERGPGGWEPGQRRIRDRRRGRRSRRQAAYRRSPCRRRRPAAVAIVADRVLALGNAIGVAEPDILVVVGRRGAVAVGLSTSPSASSSSPSAHSVLPRFAKGPASQQRGRHVVARRPQDRVRVEGPGDRPLRRHREEQSAEDDTEPHKALGRCEFWPPCGRSITAAGRPVNPPSGWISPPPTANVQPTGWRCETTCPPSRSACRAKAGGSACRRTSFIPISSGACR